MVIPQALVRQVRSFTATDVQDANLRHRRCAVTFDTYLVVAEEMLGWAATAQARADPLFDGLKSYVLIAIGDGVLSEHLAQPIPFPGVENRGHPVKHIDDVVARGGVVHTSSLGRSHLRGDSNVPITGIAARNCVGGRLH